MVPSTDEDHIDTAVNWIRQFHELGLTADYTPSRSAVSTRRVRRQAMESTGPLIWYETEWTVYLDKRWAVELDTQGVPKGPPLRIG